MMPRQLNEEIAEEIFVAPQTPEELQAAADAAEEIVQADAGAGRFREWLDTRMARLDNDWDEVIVITGNERTGKSTLAFLIACYLDGRFHPDANIAFTGPAYSRMSARLGRKRVLILDEATEGAFNADSNSAENKGLFKYLTVAGERNQIHIINWPNIRFMDKRIKSHRSHWNIHVHRRYRDHAVAEVRLLKEGEWIYDPPKPCFPFKYGRADGPLWEAYKRAKAAFVQDVGRGTDDHLVLAREDFLDQTRRRLQALVGELVHA